ncbi:MAG TPA: efflux RND transporter periplasmic adaptor subunit [Pseudomonadales bacterium]|nr:efflux RND transporter periplasmic adaptor subunit [Pseudomonadales bacterium]
MKKSGGFGLLAMLWVSHVVAGELVTVPAKQATVPQERWFDARVQAVHQSTVSAETSGRVQEILFDVGDVVPAGAVILKLVSTQQQQGYSQAAATLAEARANADVQGREFQRVQELQARQLIAKAEFDRTSGSYKAAQARLASAEAAVKAATENLSYTEVKAPFGGKVYARYVELGEAVQPGKPLMSGFDPDALRVETDLPSTVAQHVETWRQARVVADSGQIIKPDKFLLFPQADPVTGTVHLRLDLPGQTTGLQPGQFVKVAVVTGENVRLLVPASSVVHRSEVSGAYVLDQKGRLQLRQLRLGNRFGDQQEVLAGLSEGEQVALDPVAAGVSAANRIGGHE